MRRLLFGLAACTLLAACARSRNYPPRTFAWTGDVPAGNTVKVRNIDGTIAVLPSTTGHVTVNAVIVNAALGAVEVKEEQEDGNLTVCTVLNATAGDGCGASKHERGRVITPWSFFNGRHSITVRYTIHVPPGVKVDVETVNGRIAAQNIAATVKAETVNGNIEATTTVGAVNATTVNGSIVVSMASLPDSENIHLETVNGSITAVIPQGIGGSLDLENSNGTITANYPHAAPDSTDAHHLRANLLPGSRTVHLETVNGSVTVTGYVKPTSISLVY